MCISELGTAESSLLQKRSMINLPYGNVHILKHRDTRRTGAEGLGTWLKTYKAGQFKARGISSSL